MRSMIIGGLSLLLFSTSAATAARKVQWRSANLSAGFKDWRAEIRRWVHKDASQERNSVCVVVEDDGRGDIQAFAYWPQQQLLASYLPGDGPLTEQSRTPGSGLLDLKHDIVPTLADVKGSTFREPRSWLDAIVRKCRRYGVTLSVSKSKA